MKIIELSKHSKFGIAFEENNDLLMKNFEILASKLVSNSKFNEQRILINEISLSRHASSYGLLGGEFTPSDTNDLLIEVRYSKNEEIYKKSLSNEKGFTYVGLTKEFALAVEKGIKNYFLQSKLIPSGKIIVKMAANCEYGSSVKIFICLIKILLEILFNDYKEISNDKIEKIRNKRLLEEFKY